MIVLGIDPGTASLGYGIVERKGAALRMVDGGTFHTKPDSSLPKRLLLIHAFLDELIATHQPDVMAVERLFFSGNAQTAFAVGQARGVVLLAAAQAEVPVREATPSEVKVAVTGHGRADKEQVGRMVAVCLSLDAAPHPDDTADALAIAIWAANVERDSGGPDRRSSVLDRASVDPIAAGESAYARAVREALSRERASGR
ncbi:MAG TPA: crossover junction endodeoxyribonuclease RuvC [Candidatus Limnocylindria bacterium]|nr:crossover junction endodeoxyribonuclease RuvC [Candidatus Limnocylindria bacterium]